MFIKHLLTFASIIAASGVLGLPAASSDNTTYDTLADCLGAKDVPVYFVSSPDFATYSLPFNLRLQYTQAVIVLPTTVQHVSDAVVCAGEFDIKVQPKSGGHSYASYSSGGQDGSMEIYLQSFQNVTVDSSTGIATVGTGVRLGNLDEAIYSQGERALPHGTCPGVGVGGHFLHGGYGYDSRNWGLALDTIVGLDVVLANGSFVHATSSENSDIYWALRGAGDSFGIVTTFYIQTEAAPTDGIVYFQYSIPDTYTSAATAASIFLHLQDFALNTSVVDRNIGFGVYMTGSAFSISGTFFGTLDNFTSTIAPELLRTLPAPSSQNVQTMAWLDAQVQLGGEPLATPLNYTAHDSFFAKSLVTPTESPLTEAGLEAFFQYIIDNAPGYGNPWFSIVNLYGGPDSQINVQDTTFSSYAHRDALWVFQNYGDISDIDSPFPTDAVETFIGGLNSAIPNAMPDVDFLAYLNYVDPTLTADEAHTLYYGDEVLPRLESLKTTYDPAQLLWNPQSIGN
jgi:hypothetical protein